MDISDIDVIIINLNNYLSKPFIKIITKHNLKELEGAKIHIIDNNNTTIIPPIDHLEETNPYFNYINMNLIDVDFSNLLSINSDTSGWIQVPGTNVNYPFVKTTDNSFYLNHSFDKSLLNLKIQVYILHQILKQASISMMMSL